MLTAFIKGNLNTLLICALLTLPGFSAAQTSSGIPKKKLRVITYNILNGYEYGKDSVREKHAADFIASFHPDVVALEELCGFTEAKLAAFARKWGHPYAVILKEDGYPVGLTSNEPILLKMKMRKDLWHGMLHASTHGIDFFVVHLRPTNHEFRQKEARLITAYMRETLNDESRYMVLGDFNSHSPFDAYLDKGRPALLELYRKNDALHEDRNNLSGGEFDYSVISTFLAFPLVDVCEQKIEGDKRFSYPTPILIGTYRKPGEVEPTRERLDYILVSETMATSCTDARIINSGIVDALSDHFPVVADFEMP